MVMIIMHVAYITCFVTDDGWHSCDVIGVNNIHLRAGGISYFAEPAILRWLERLSARSGPVTFNGAINTVVG